MDLNRVDTDRFNQVTRKHIAQPPTLQPPISPTYGCIEHSICIYLFGSILAVVRGRIVVLSVVPLVSLCFLVLELTRAHQSSHRATDACIMVEIPP